MTHSGNILLGKAIRGLLWLLEAVGIITPIEDEDEIPDGVDESMAYREGDHSLLVMAILVSLFLFITVVCLDYILWVLA